MDFLFLYNTSDGDIAAVQGIGCILDAALGIRRAVGSMYDSAVSCQDRYMSGIYDDISCLVLRPGNCSSASCLRVTGTGQAVAEVCEYLLGKSGTVDSVCQAVSAVYIRISDELLCIRHDL